MCLKGGRGSLECSACSTCLTALYFTGASKLRLPSLQATDQAASIVELCLSDYWRPILANLTPEEIDVFPRVCRAMAVVGGPLLSVSCLVYGKPNRKHHTFPFSS